MSKFERYKKSDEPDIFPHRHCKGCKTMIDESKWYCPECYRKLQEKKKKRRFLRKKKKEISTSNSDDSRK